MKFRPLSGSSTTCRLSMTVPSVAVAVSSIGAVPTASTVSLSDPICRPKSKRTVCWICSSTWLRAAPRKPSISTLTLYTPGRRLGNTYRPALLACWAAVAPVCVLVTVTVAPTRTPPVVSVTMPVICPNVCAKDGNAGRSKKLSTTMHSNVLRMGPPLVVKGGQSKRADTLCPSSFVQPQTSDFSISTQTQPTYLTTRSGRILHAYARGKYSRAVQRHARQPVQVDCPQPRQGHEVREARIGDALAFIQVELFERRHAAQNLETAVS